MSWQQETQKTAVSFVMTSVQGVCHHEECTNDNPGFTLSNLQESCSPPCLNGEICHKNDHNKRIQYVTTICEFHFKS